MILAITLKIYFEIYFIIPNYLNMNSVFHKFIEVSANRPADAAIFSEFAYMQQEIRKNYNQLKNQKAVVKPNQDFVDYWKEIGKEGREQQVAVYFRWIELLQKARTQKIQRQLCDREAELYVRKSMIGKWEKRKVKLNGLILQIFSKQLREYPLHCFCIRKSKNKQHFSWVMQVVMQLQQSKFKSFNIGSNNVLQFQEWFRDVESRIYQARMQYFRDFLSLSAQKNKIKQIGQNRLQSKQSEPQKLVVWDTRQKNKTITQLVIDNELKKTEQLEELQVIEESQTVQIKEEETHPNIFNRLFPKRELQRFTQNPQKVVLIEIDKQHRLYQLQDRIKLFLTISYNISAVFRIISQSHLDWNPQIEVFNIKNTISSQNSVLVYQKDKSKGFLYRERDYLFVRHCFSIDMKDKNKRIFMVQKSIDSIHTPPFMTVARGDKQLIWCLVGGAEDKECLLVVQGIIKGGGYMNINQDKQTTIRHFKKLMQLDNYLKQKQYLQTPQSGYLFRQNWVVNLKEQQQQQFYSPRPMGFDEEQEVPSPLNQSKQREEKVKNIQKTQEQFNQFIKQTSQQDINQQIAKEQNRFNFTNQDMSTEYIPPQFAADRTVIVPQAYLHEKHITQPKPKGKQRWCQPTRGHPLWKGQWAVSQAGGLLYVDEQKMRQQKKVLTFIIKRIGKNILSGKGILNVSLPVDIFCRESNIERLAMSFGYCPVFLEKVANAQNPIQQLKAVLASSMGSSLIYLTMQKPFNPILGETYQSWIDGCPVYFEQISHHPPVAAFLMKGRGYQIYGSIEAKMDLSINSGTGINQGIFTVKFQNGRKFHFTTPPGQLYGLTYGERKLTFVRESYFWSIEEGIFVEISYNPLAKQKGFFGGGGKNLVGDERLADYFQGYVRYYKPEQLKQFLAPKKNDIRRLMAIPKGVPGCDILSQGQKIHGRWTKQVFYGQEKIFDADRDVYLLGFDEKSPLPSHSNFRQDVVYRRLNNFVLSQEFKQVLEVKQRKDRKIREDFKKKLK